MKRFSIGDLIIINDCDRPSAELVAIVTAAKDGLYGWRYINDEKRLKNYGCQRPESTLKLATKLEDFGVTLVLDEMQYWCIVTGEYVAKYPDGKSRKWQGYVEDVFTVTKSAKKLLSQKEVQS